MSDTASCDAGVPTAKPCGTVRGYRAGCRCLGCRVAIREHNKRYREKKPGEVRAAARRRELMNDYGLTPERLIRDEAGAGLALRDLPVPVPAG